MNEKEIAEIRRRFRPEKNNISQIRGCFVSAEGNIVSEFHQSMAMMPAEESENFLALLKRTLSGSLGKNLIDIAFQNRQVVDSEEHRLLMRLRDSHLGDEEALHRLYDTIIGSVSMEENYLILIAYDSYDIPFRGRDGSRLPDASRDMYSYVLCSICPTKLPKPALSYLAAENTFQTAAGDFLVAPPKMGFLFPAFDDRCTNLYNALYYTKDPADSHEALIDALFKLEAPMPAVRQREVFQEILRESLGEDCSFDTVSALQNNLARLIQLHKEDKESEPLTLSKNQLGEILRETGATDRQVACFCEAFQENFGENRRLSPGNLVDVKQIHVVLPDVKIQVAADRQELLDAKIIDGLRYITILAQDGVELGGMAVNITAPKD